MKIILASSSPRRKEILKTLGFRFTITEPGIAESARGARAVSRYVQDCAKAKANAALRKLSRQNDVLIIAADTVVASGKMVLGKPESKEDALRMIKRLSGKTHQVFTGVALLVYTMKGKNGRKSRRKMNVFFEKTNVKFKKISKRHALNYIRTQESMDKAGAYAIQGKGARFIKSIQGCYFNVVGFPVYKFGMALKEMGVHI